MSSEQETKVEVQWPGDVSHPSECELVSIAQLGHYFTQGRLTGGEAVRIGREGETITVNEALRMASAGLLRPPLHQNKSADARPVAPTAADIETALKAMRRAEAALSSDMAALQKSGEVLADLSSTADLADGKAMAKVSLAMAVKAIGPQRIEVRREELSVSQQSLLVLCQSFATLTAAAKVRALESRVAAQAEAKLSAHYSEPDALAGAVAQSTLVREAAAIAQELIIRDYATENAGRTAEQLLAAWRSAEQLEQRL